MGCWYLPCLDWISENLSLNQKSESSSLTGQKLQGACFQAYPEWDSKNLQAPGSLAARSITWMPGHLFWSHLLYTTEPPATPPVPTALPSPGLWEPMLRGVNRRAALRSFSTPPASRDTGGLLPQKSNESLPWVEFWGWCPIPGAISQGPRTPDKDTALPSHFLSTPRFSWALCEGPT